MRTYGLLYEFLKGRDLLDRRGVSYCIQRDFVYEVRDVKDLLQLHFLRQGERLGVRLQFDAAIGSFAPVLRLLIAHDL